MIYHICCIIISASETAGIYLLGKFGESKLLTCFIRENSDGEILYLFPVVVNFPIATLSVIMMINKKKRKNSLKPSTIAMISLIITLGFSTILMLIGYFYPEAFIVRYYFEISSCCAGFFFVIGYLCNPYTIKKIKNKNKPSEAFYFQHNSALIVNQTMTYSMTVDALKITEIEMLGNFLDDKNKRVTIT